MEKSDPTGCTEETSEVTLGEGTLSLPWPVPMEEEVPAWGCQDSGGLTPSKGPAARGCTQFIT